MRLEELIYLTKGSGFDSIVCQTEIKTEEDKAEYSEKGYNILHTVEEFTTQYGIDPTCVWYSPSFSLMVFYFNKESLAVMPLQALYMKTLEGKTDVELVKKLIRDVESEVARGDYFSSLMNLTDAMQLDYIRLLVEKKKPCKDLYKLFSIFYVQSDYGFSSLDREIIDRIVESKTPAQKGETTKKLKNLPDVVTVYRGENNRSTSYKDAYSWTTDEKIAYFFACRHGDGPANIIKGEVRKKDIIELFDERNESEVFVYPDKVKVLGVNELYGLEYIKTVLPIVLSRYQKYRDRMIDELDFDFDSREHGKLHSARVLLLCLIMAEELKLPTADKKVLAEAAIYHDSKRTNDGTDFVHGREGAEYYKSDVRKPDPVVSFICEYHCLEDEEGYEEIKNNRQLSKNRTRSKLLLNIFKDADNLDLCRFGLKYLDYNKLRLELSKKMVLVAKILYDQIILPE